MHIYLKHACIKASGLFLLLKFTQLTQHISKNVTTVTTYSSFLEFKFGNIRPFLQVLFIL